MPITFDCICGKRYRVKDEAAGRSFACQACRQKVIVPSLLAVDLEIDLGPQGLNPPANTPAAMNGVGLVSLMLGLTGIALGLATTVACVSLIVNKFRVE